MPCHGTDSHQPSMWRPGFNPSPVQVKFVVNKLELEKVFSLVFPVSIMPPVLHMHISLYTLPYAFRAWTGKRSATIFKHNVLVDIPDSNFSPDFWSLSACRQHDDVVTRQGTLFLEWCFSPPDIILQTEVTIKYANNLSGLFHNYKFLCC